MTSVSKASAFPKSVKAGIPKLGACPEGWVQQPLAKHLFENLRPVELRDSESYDLVTVKRSRGGVVKRERLTGAQISVKTQFRVEGGDFLISKRQIVHGACGLVPPDLAGSIVSNEYSILGTKPSIDLRFLSYLAHSLYFQQTCFHSSIGVHVEKMIFKLDQWLAWKFNLPPIAEQRRIAEILSTWDSAIEVVEALIAGARAQKRALMQQLLTGAARLPGFSGSWNVVRISDFCTTYSGGTPSRSRPEYFKGSIPWIKSGELNRKEIFKTEEFISSDGLDNSSAKLVNEDTILVAMYGATAGVVSVSRIKAAINQAILAIIPNGTVDHRFLKFALVNAMESVNSLTQGGQPNLNAGIIGKMKLRLPNEQEQQAIAAVLHAAETDIALQTKQLDALRIEKAALMQELLTGKRRVKVVEEAAA